MCYLVIREDLDEDHHPEEEGRHEDEAGQDVRRQKVFGAGPKEI